MADTPLSPGQVELYPSCTPVWSAGAHQLELTQEASAEGQRLLEVDRERSFTIVVAGGDEPLGPTDVLAAYPVPSSRDASQLMLPHVALRRRTLPWELELPASPGGSPPPEGTPWLALVLLHADDAPDLAPAGAGALATLRVASPVLRRILPAKDEVALLCHVRRVSTADLQFAGDDDGQLAIVLGNRLPRAPGSWTAALVDLREAWNLPVWPGSSGDDRVVPLPVLHAWRFEVADGGDFEQLCGRLREDSATFGAAHPGGVELRHQRREGAATTSTYRSPLAGGAAPTSARDAAPSFSDEAMFELGRLLALADGGAVTHLQALRDQAWEEVWFETIHTQFLDRDGLPLGGPGLPGLTSEMRAQMAAILRKAENEWLTSINGGLGGLRGGRSDLEGLLRQVVPGQELPDGLLDLIKELGGGGVTDPVRRPDDRSSGLWSLLDTILGRSRTGADAGPGTGWAGGILDRLRAETLRGGRR